MDVGAYAYALVTIVVAGGFFVGWHVRGWWVKHGTPSVRIIDATRKPRATIRKL
jgi:hypothetical protein